MCGCIALCGVTVVMGCGRIGMQKLFVQPAAAATPPGQGCCLPLQQCTRDVLELRIQRAEDMSAGLSANNSNEAGLKAWLRGLCLVCVCMTTTQSSCCIT